MPNEMEPLERMKLLVKTELQSYPQYPEVVGDRRLIRFLRGYNNDPEKAAQGYLKHLRWRKEYNVDDIRNQILYGGMNDPKKFPNGELILKLNPQIVIAPHAMDNKGQPVMLEIFDFDPNKVLEQITVEQFVIFLICACEFRTLIVEQIAGTSIAMIILKRYKLTYSVYHKSIVNQFVVGLCTSIHAE